jgi:hypothetical protein
MSIITSAAATLRPAGEPSFVLPTGAVAFWQLGTSRSVLGDAGVFGYPQAAMAKPIAVDMDAVKNRRHVTQATKPARPPRGVPR